MYISRKTQLILTNSQKELIDEMIYIRRNLWNKIIEVYNPLIINKLEQKIKQVLPSQTELETFSKRLYPNSNSRLLRSCIQDYLEAWKMCFKISNRRKPHFHSCNQSELSVPMYDCNTKIKLTKKHGISFTLSGKIKDKNILFCEDMTEWIGKEVPIYSISRRNKKYYISLTFKIDKNEIESQSNEIGCDWGLKTFLTTSNNEQYNLPRSLISQEIRIKHLQKDII